MAAGGGLASLSGISSVALSPLCPSSLMSSVFGGIGTLLMPGPDLAFRYNRWAMRLMREQERRKSPGLGISSTMAVGGERWAASWTSGAMEFVEVGGEGGSTG